MFCSKCGAEAAEGAAFCEKCGAKLIVATENNIRKGAVQADMRETAGPMVSEERALETSNIDDPTSTGNVYDLLQKNASNCPEIKKVYFQQKIGITTLKGKKNRYFVGSYGGGL